MGKNETKFKEYLSRKARTLKGNSQNRGITLIALVITIIILLILAGITIATLSNSGLFSKTQEAKEKWNGAEQDENEKIAKYSNEIDGYVDGDRNTITLTEEELNQRINSIVNNKIEIIDTESPSTLRSWAKVANYPNGFNYDNCYIDAAYVIIDNRKYSIPAGDTTAWLANISLTAQGIEMYLQSNNEFCNKDVKIILVKYN